MGRFKNVIQNKVGCFCYILWYFEKKNGLFFKKNQRAPSSDKDEEELINCLWECKMVKVEPL